MSRGVPLKLDRFIPIRDVRKLVWRYLNEYDRFVVKCTHVILKHYSIGGSIFRGSGLDKFDYYCVEFGYISLLEWIVQHQYHIGRWTFNAAAIYGRLAICQWMYQGNMLHPDLGETAYFAAMHGQLRILQWVHSVGGRIFQYDVVRAARENGHVDVLKWLDEVATQMKG